MADDIPEQAYEPINLDEIRAHGRAAHAELVAICEGKRKWTMSVPADPERDSDLLLARALEDLAKLGKEVERLRAAGSKWEYGYRIVYREGASVWPDGIGPVAWCGSEQLAREAGPAYMRLECISPVTGRIDIVRRRPAGPVEVVPASEEQPS